MNEGSGAFSIRAARLSIPFRRTVKHAAATRNETEALWVEISTPEGIVGYGESCPREYVTGESGDSVFEFVRRGESSFKREIRDLPSLKDWCRRHRAEIDRSPAAWCAVELALLDLFAKRARQVIEEYLGFSQLAGPFRYTAILGDNELPLFEQQFSRYLSLGFRDFKVKVTGDIRRDRGKMEIISKRGGIPPERIRLDANNLWADADEAIRYLKELGSVFCAVEEPVAVGDYSGMARIAAELGVRIILDESFCRIAQLDELTEPRETWQLNVRVSKMGGLLRSLEVVERASELGLPLIVGAHVGQTSLLTRASLTVAHRGRRNLLAQEGAFGTHLLVADVCTETSLMFGKDGLLSGELPNHGSGGFGVVERSPTRFLRSFESRE